AGPARPLDLGRTAGGFLVQARIAAAARVEVGVGDPIAFLQRPTERVGLDLAAEARHPAGHFVAVDPAVVGQPQRRVAAPEVQVGAAHVGQGDADDDGLRLDLRQRDLADLERLAGPEEDRRLARDHSRTPSRPSSKASCSARTASSAYLSSITQETAISEVEIIWMLMPSLESAENIRAATPEWLRMPTPTM